MPTLRVVESRICRGSGGFGRSVERFGGFSLGAEVGGFVRAVRVVFGQE